VDKGATLSSSFAILVFALLILARISLDMALTSSAVVMVAHGKRVGELGEPRAQIQGSDTKMLELVA
jgi:hypothetical protein